MRGCSHATSGLNHRRRPWRDSQTRSRFNLGILISTPPPWISLNRREPCRPTAGVKRPLQRGDGRSLSSLPVSVSPISASTAVLFGYTHARRTLGTGAQLHRTFTPGDRFAPALIQTKETLDGVPTDVNAKRSAVVLNLIALIPPTAKPSGDHLTSWTCLPVASGSLCVFICSFGGYVMQLRLVGAT